MPATFVKHLEAGQPQHLIMYGTSLTAERCLLEAYASGAWVDDLRRALERRYPEQARVTNRARHGMTSVWGVQHLARRVLSQQPDVVFIEFAINDADVRHQISVEQSRRNLEAMIHALRRRDRNVEVVLLTMNVCVGEHAELRPQLAAYYQGYRDVALSRGLSLIDCEPHWRALLESDRAAFHRYVPDGIHPNHEGCAAVLTPVLEAAIFD